MPLADPKAIRYAPGTADVPPGKQIQEWPTDSAVWMNIDPPEYEDGPLFPDTPDDSGGGPGGSGSQQATKAFDPHQRRDPHTGEWSDGNGVSLAEVEKGSRLEFTTGTEHGTGKLVENFRGTVAQKTGDGRLMVNAGTPKKPRWVVTNVSHAAPIVRAQPATRGDSKRKYRDALTSDEVKALDAYMGPNYQSINGTLREGRDASAVTRKRIAALDSAVRKGQIEQDTTLYRAAGFKQGWDALVGKTFVDQGFVSTSEATQLPLMMSNRPNGAFIRIKVPAGAHVGYLHKFRNQQAVSKYDGVPEKEVLLPRDSAFRVTSARRDRDGVWHVDMELAT